MKTKKIGFVLVGGVFLLVLIYAGLLLYFTWPINEFSINKSGVFGDSFGLLTSLFSGLAFAGLIITILMQKEELALQREELSDTRKILENQKEEMEKQNQTLRIQMFENTFFNMLNLLEDCRRNISHRRSSGREAIENIYKIFIGRHMRENDPDSSASSLSAGSTRFKESCYSTKGIGQEYRRFYEVVGDELGQYFRTLYNILKFVSEAEYIDQKRLYTNLVRAQLSRYELSLLFYNCLSEYGEKQMAPLVKEFNLLKHLEKNTLPAENLEIWESFK